MIAGDLLGRPVPLPLSRCSLLVDPRGVLHAFLLDRAGEATVAFPLPRMQGVDINFQAIALDLGAGRTAALVATKGQHLGCRWTKRLDLPLEVALRFGLTPGA